LIQLAKFVDQSLRRRYRQSNGFMSSLSKASFMSLSPPSKRSNTSSVPLWQLLKSIKNQVELGRQRFFSFQASLPRRTEKDLAGHHILFGRIECELYSFYPES
jgi:hypothetical protein